MANVRKDRFGNEFQLIGCKDKNGSGFSKGYLELKGDLYKIEPSVAQKEGYEYWVKVTKVPKQKKTSNW